MNKHGFTSSYSEVLRFEQSAAVSNATSIPGLSESDTNPSHFMQFSADNTDHNLRTLDGHGTFHGISIIASVTPTLSVAFKVPRLDDVSTDDPGPAILGGAKGTMPPPLFCQAKLYVALEFKSVESSDNTFHILDNGCTCSCLLNP